MDLLSQRYANPCFFLNGVIQTGQLDEFVEEIVQIRNEEKEEQALWDYFLSIRAASFEGSFNEFKEMQKVNDEHKRMSEKDIETTVQHSIDILNGFNPEKGGE